MIRIAFGLKRLDAEMVFVDLSKDEQLVGTATAGRAQDDLRPDVVILVKPCWAAGPNQMFERTARQRGWRVPSRLRRSAAAQRER